MTDSAARDDNESYLTSLDEHEIYGTEVLLTSVNSCDEEA